MGRITTHLISYCTLPCLNSPQYSLSFLRQATTLLFNQFAFLDYKESIAILFSYLFSKHAFSHAMGFAAPLQSPSHSRATC